MVLNSTTELKTTKSVCLYDNMQSDYWYYNKDRNIKFDWLVEVFINKTLLH